MRTVFLLSVGPALLTSLAQYAPKLTIKVNVGGEIIEEDGQLFTEATFIS